MWERQHCRDDHSEKKVVGVLLGHTGEAATHLNVLVMYKVTKEWCCWRDSSSQPIFDSVLVQICLHPVLSVRSMCLLEVLP